VPPYVEAEGVTSVFGISASQLGASRFQQGVVLSEALPTKNADTVRTFCLQQPPVQNRLGSGPNA
jgi:hypothetical protein